MAHDLRNITITGAQLRAARAMLKWKGEDLAEKSGVSLATIRRNEPLDGPLRMTGPNMSAIRAALEAAGVEFIAEDGVLLRRPFPKR
jgi:transcriptional regulator with XRE-family HTH domain